MRAATGGHPSKTGVAGSSYLRHQRAGSPRGIGEGGGMGLDVYVGSLTRYHAEGPADVVERIARHQAWPWPTARTGRR